MTEPTKQQMLDCLDKIIQQKQFDRGEVGDGRPAMSPRAKMTSLHALDLDISVLRRCKVIIAETMPEVIEHSCSDLTSKDRHSESLRTRELEVGQEAVQRSH